MGIRSNGKVVVPGSPDGSIGITNGDSGGCIVTDDGIRSTDPDLWSWIDPNSYTLNNSTAAIRITIIGRNTRCEDVNDLVNNRITVS